MGGSSRLQQLLYVCVLESEKESGPVPYPKELLTRANNGEPAQFFAGQRTGAGH
jgi:hypothetical protein